MLRILPARSKLRRLALSAFLCVAVRADAAGLKSIFHLDLDDCDDVAADSRSLYFACHSTHAPGKTPTNPPNMDAWVAKLDRRSGKVLYLTQLGGQGLDIADRVKVDGRGHAYVTGFTASRDFPVTANAVQRTYGGGDSDAFLAELDGQGRVVYATYVGGDQADQGDGLALGLNGEVWIAGTTWSGDFPHVKKRFGATGKGDLFVAHFGTAGVAAVVLGGSNPEKLTGIAVGPGGVFVTGYTESTDFPVVRALQPKLNGASDAFVAAFDGGLGSVLFSTHIGGSGNDSAWGIALDSGGNPVLAGITESDDLPVPESAFQKRRGGQADAFVMKLDGLGQKVLLATYYGGSGLDHSGYDGGNIAVSAGGTIWVEGLTNSRDLRVPGGYQSRYGGGEQDGFVIAVSASGKLCYGTYAGSSARALLEGVTLADSDSMVYAVGTVIRPVEKGSPGPRRDEKYGMFVVGLKAPRACR